MRIVCTTYGMTGLVGTISYTIYNSDGTVYAAPTTAGITEVPTTSGVYNAVVADAILAGRMILWNLGGSIYATESFPAVLTGASSASVARTLAYLAIEAKADYDHAETPTYARHLLYAYRRFVRRVGGIYTGSYTFTATEGVSGYDLPEDFRALKPSGVVMTYGDDNTVSILTRTTLEEVRAQSNPTNDLPSSYYFPDAWHIALYHAPDDTEISIALTYDAQVPGSFAYTDVPAIPKYVEEGLIGYAHARIAERMRPEPDSIMRNMGDGKFEDAVKAFLLERSGREESTTRLTPHDTDVTAWNTNDDPEIEYILLPES